MGNIMKKHSSLFLWTAAALLIGPDYWVPAQAQGLALEEIVVTARKREENLMKVPLGITAFTSEMLESRGIDTLAEVSAFTPGLFSITQVGGGSGRNDRSSKQVVLRGFSLSPGLLFVDSAPFLGGGTPEVSDVERIEILKGPQSAYFGRSTFSGAINFVTKDPANDEFRGRAKLEASSYDSTDISLSLEGPIIKDRLALRVYGHSLERGGQYTNFVDPGVKLGQQSTSSVTAQLVFTPSDALKVKFYATMFTDDDGPPAQIAMKPPVDMNCNLGGTKNNGLWYCGTIPNADEFPAEYISGQWIIDDIARASMIDNAAGFPTAFDPGYLKHGGLKRDSFQSNLVIDYDFENGYKLTSITAYRDEKNQQDSNLSFRDGQNVANPFFGAIPGVRPTILWYVVVQSENRDFSQELRLSSPEDRDLRFLLGLNYLSFTNPGGAGVFGNTPIGDLVLSSTTLNESRTPAAFGGIYYDLTDDLTVSAELRYQSDEVTRQALTTSSGALIPGGGPLFEETFTSFSPRITADYNLTDDQMVYALWSRGFRPGGFNVNLAVQPPEILAQFNALGVGIAFEEEQLDNYEVGLKSTWLDGRAQTTISLYKEEWSNGQTPINIIFTLPPPQVGVNQITAVSNVGAVDLSGLEFEGSLQVTEEFNLSATYGYTDSDIRVFTCGDCLTVRGTDDGTGNRLPQAPKNSWSLSGQYTDRLFGGYDWYGRVDYTERGEFFVSFANAALVGAKTNVNLRLGIQRDDLSVEAFVTNLTEDTTPIGATLGPEALFTIATDTEIRYALPDKRMFGVRASFSF
jgi:iron complex outermembrane receptor protein